MRKKLDEMSDAELLEEYSKWDEKIKTATGWGAALSAADEFRRAAIIACRRRGLKLS